MATRAAPMPVTSVSRPKSRSAPPLTATSAPAPATATAHTRAVDVAASPLAPPPASSAAKAADRRGKRTVATGTASTA